jgi:5-methylcytosine-specific restriction protein A
MKLDAPLKRDALLAVCALAPPPRSGACAWCDADLPPRRRTWCSDRCNDAFWANHWWSVARTTAKRRDRYRCRRCGARGPKRPTLAAHRTRAAYLKAMRAYREQKKVARLEVNHLDPALGRHGELSCVHHLANLETLCLSCHKEHSAASRARASAPPKPEQASARNRVAVCTKGARATRPDAVVAMPKSKRTA